MPTLPADLLHAVAERGRRVALVVGAGCSLEQPTGLKLAGAYAEDAHAQLVRDGVLAEGDCSDPSDLSALATAVQNKTGGQAALIQRLPVSKFRLAQPNSGYLLAAALLRERVLDAVLTLNFDLAMTTALGVLGADEVNVVPGPMASDQLASSAVVYLHRNVNELNLERWILTVEALANEWRDGWEEVVARRIMASPVVVFAGLGSPAAVLTETVSKLKKVLDPTQHHVFVVDPANTSAFEAALELPSNAHIRTGWCAFMGGLGARVMEEYSSGLSDAGKLLCAQHSWSGEDKHVEELSQRLHSVGLVALGKLRAHWLLSREPYTPDDARRSLIADLLLGIGLIQRASANTDLRFREDGTVEFVRDGISRGRVLPVSGGGTLRWSAVEPLVAEALAQLAGHEYPEWVILAGIVGDILAPVGPPADLVTGDAPDDLVTGFSRPTMITVDEIRSDSYGFASRVVA